MLFQTYLYIESNLTLFDLTNIYFPEFLIKISI